MLVCSMVKTKACEEHMHPPCPRQSQILPCTPCKPDVKFICVHMQVHVLLIWEYMCSTLYLYMHNHVHSHENGKQVQRSNQLILHIVRPVWLCLASGYHAGASGEACYRL